MSFLDRIFGREISDNLSKTGDVELSNDKDQRVSPVPKVDADGSTVVSVSGPGGYVGHYIDLDGTSALDDIDLIQKYRSAAEQPECDAAIDDICNEAIFFGDKGAPVNLHMDDWDVDESVKTKVTEEFSKIQSLLNFAEDGADIFRNWYIDGRIFFQVIIDPDNPKEGIQELRYIDPLRIRKYKEVELRKDEKTGIEYQHIVSEYFVYSDNYAPVGNLVQTITSGTHIAGVKLDANSIIYVNSGKMNVRRTAIVSYLHKALKLINQVNMMTNALVIYRLARAPERRIFYIDVGSLPKGKAEEYVQGVMSKYRNKMVYDAQTGEIRDDRKHMSMLDDFWLPRREGGKGTEVSTLPGGQNLGQIDDVVYFQKQLYKALNVPTSRLDTQNSVFNIGRAAEISREEVKFQKFIDRLRRRFSYIFIDALKIQLILKGIISDEDWLGLKESIALDYARDNYFAELKNFEILKERVKLLDDVEQRIGKLISKKWVYKNILGFSDDDISRMKNEMRLEELGKDEDDPTTKTDEPGLFGRNPSSSGPLDFVDAGTEVADAPPADASLEVSPEADSEAGEKKDVL